MSTADKIRGLIERTTTIKKNFHLENSLSLSSYNWRKRERKTSYLQVEKINDDPEFLRWRDELVLYLSQLKKDDYIGEVIKLLEKFDGFTDKKKFEQVESKLSVLKEHIEEYIINSNNLAIVDERVQEEELLNKVLRAVLKLQKNHAYNLQSSENEMNDYIRDILDESFETKDQTRQGKSEEENDAGEVDIQLYIDGIPGVMIEGLILDSVSKVYLDNHIKKVLVNYDPNGCPYAFVIIYYKGNNLKRFYDRLIVYLDEFQFPYKRLTEIVNVDVEYAELKHAQTVLLRNDKRIRVHFYVVHIV